MKAINSLLILILFVISSGCEKQNSQDAEIYISLLKSGKFDYYDLPDLKASDIPTLLNYVNSTTTLTKFPRNGASSFMQAECSLGMIVLWTIESIREVEIGSDRLIGRFPSLNPVLAFKQPPYDWIFDNSAQSVAAKAYKDWWNSTYIFRDKMKIDPLESTPFMWH